jgi:TPR repeat protein
MSTAFKGIKLCMLITAALIGQAYAMDKDVPGDNPKLTPRVVYGENQKSLEIPEGSKINPTRKDIGKPYYDLAMKYLEEGQIELGIIRLEHAVSVQYPPAQVEFALFHITGEYGIKKDKALAVKLLKRAAGQGSEDALFWLKEIRPKGLCGKGGNFTQALLSSKLADSSESTKKKRTQITDNHLPIEHSETGAIGPEQLAYILGNLYY